MGPSGRHVRYLTLAMVAGPAVAMAQGDPNAAPTIARVEVSPKSIMLTVGDSIQVTARAVDATGKEVPATVSFSTTADGVAGSQLTTPFRGVVGVVYSRESGWLRATRAGEFALVVTARVPAPPAPSSGFPNTTAPRRGGVTTRVPVTVRTPPITNVAILGDRMRLFVGSVLTLDARATDARGAVWDDAPLTWQSSNPAVAAVDKSGEVTAVAPGSVTISVRSGEARGAVTYAIVPSPVRRIALKASAADARTGDVIRLTAEAYDGAGRRVADAPIAFSVASAVEDTVIAQFAPAEVDQRGRFVAQKGGRHTVFATTPGAVGRVTLTIRPRDVAERVTVVGRAPLTDKMTTDLYVWTARDGRDYMITGTFNAGGQAYFYDVTDPANQILLDSVVVDARTVNDVYVDDTGTICIIAREGASTRRNGIVLVDCSDPRRPKVISSFEDGLTGGVHNVNYWNKRVFAISNTTRYDIINIEDPAKPYRESFVELEAPGHAIHDVWVVDGLAYSSWWKDGVVIHDVGNGKYGGTPSKPVHVASYAYPLGTTHAAYPYRSPTGKFYVIAGDEIFPYGVNFNPGGTPPRAGGYAHIIDFSDPRRPEEVARYEVPEAGAHNFWVEGDRLYASFYNGGLRVVDLSGELKGNLYYQNREIAAFLPMDPKGMIANAPFTTGPQLHKGHIFFADAFTGIWAVKLEPRRPPVP